MIPRNPFIADSPWPIAQCNNYAQASTLLPGPFEKGGAKVDALLDYRLADPISLLYTSDGKVVWGSSLTHVFKLDRSTKNLRIVDLVPKSEELRQNDTFHGAYSVLSSEGIYYTATLFSIEAYKDKEEGNSTSKIKFFKRWKMDDRLESESIIGLSMTYDGVLVFGTNRGRIGVLSRNLERLIDMVHLADDGDKVTVSNSLALDEDGGIYSVTSKYLHKTFWDPIEQELRPAWDGEYDVGDHGGAGRLSAQGSGSTPSLLFHEKHGRFVAITDGGSLMNVVVFNATSGAKLAEHPVTFGDPRAATSYSDQSILVSGMRMVVVNNALTRRGELVESALQLAVGGPDGIEHIVKAQNLPPIISEVADLWPALLGDAPRGVEQFEFDPVSRSLRTTWARPDLAIPNGIPTMSEWTGLMYAVGKRKWRGASSAELGTGWWSLEALHWWTGKDAFTVRLGDGPNYNSLYAATEIGVGEIISGVLGGVVRVRQESLFLDGTPNKPPTAASGGQLQQRGLESVLGLNITTLTNMPPRFRGRRGDGNGEGILQRDIGREGTRRENGARRHQDSHEIGGRFDGSLLRIPDNPITTYSELITYLSSPDMIASTSTVPTSTGNGKGPRRGQNGGPLLSGKRVDHLLSNGPVLKPIPPPIPALPLMAPEGLNAVHDSISDPAAAAVMAAVTHNAEEQRNASTAAEATARQNEAQKEETGGKGAGSEQAIIPVRSDIDLEALLTSLGGESGEEGSSS